MERDVMRRDMVKRDVVGRDLIVFVTPAEAGVQSES